MPFTTFKIIEGDLNDQQRTSLVANVTEAMNAKKNRASNWEVIVKLKRRAGLTVVKLSHVSQGAVGFSGRIQGSMVGQGYPLYK